MRAAYVIVFLFGMFVGGFLGIFFLALVQAGARGDRLREGVSD